MQIVALELENVKSYDHARFAFMPGVNAIVGHNGAGKSTIIEAIGFALFDALPYTAQEFVREGARTGAVAVTFLSAYDERPYRVERRFGGSNAYTVHDHELKAKICDGKADVLAFVRRHFLIEPSVDLTRLFADALGVAQGTLTTAFAETPARRKPIFDTLLQVDDYSTAADRLREPARVVKEQLAETDRLLAVSSTRLEQLPELEHAITRRAREIADAAAHRHRLEAALTVTQARLDALEAQQAVIEALAAQLARLEASARGLEAQRRRATQAREEARQAAVLVAANQGGYDAYLAAQQAQAALQATLAERQARLDARAAADKTLALTAARCAQLAQSRDEAIAAAQVVHDLADAVSQQIALSTQVAALESAHQQLDDLDRRLATLAARQRTLAQRRDEVMAGLAQARTIETEGQAINQQLATLRATLEGVRDEVTLTGAELTSLETRRVALETIDTARCPVCEQPLSTAQRTAMLTDCRTRHALLHTILADLEVRNAAHQQQLAQLEATRTQLQQEWTQLPRASELTAVTQALAELDAEWATAQESRRALADQVSALDDLRATLAALGDPRRRSAVAAERAAQRPELDAQLAAEQRRQSSAQEEITSLDRALAALGDLDGALAQHTALLRTHTDAYQAVLTNRQVAATVPQRQKELAEIEEALAQATHELAEVQQNLKVAGDQFDRADYQRVLLEDRTMRQELGSLSAAIRLTHEAQARDETQAQRLRAEQIEHDAMAQTRRQLLRKAELLDAIRGVIKQAGPYVTQALVRQVSTGAALIFGELMRDHSRVLEWGDDYGLSLATGGATRTFRQLSGGEQMSAALAVRLALVREMSKLNLAFFDEPTANLDSVRREALAQQIMSVRGFSQLFVISHDDTFEQVTHNLVRVRRDGKTTVVGDATE